MAKRDISRRDFLKTSGALAAAVATGGIGAIEDTRIHHLEIYPGIGIARVGNSELEDGYFIGPEVVTPPLTRKNGSRDKKGALKRQAARFRIYAFNKAGEVLKEVTSKEADITWTVHLANKKSQWYRFVAALDIDETVGMANERRNASVEGEDRKALAIDGGKRSIVGNDQKGKAYHFDEGNFMGTPVYLGELRTDKEGRLVVLGGRGKAASPTGEPIFSGGATFNNADGWYDDIADGPVDAEVVIDGEKFTALGSWIAVAPPNYAPDIIGWRTMYDMLVEVYDKSGIRKARTSTSFTEDVLPLLQRLSNLQWVNKWFAETYGRKREFDFYDPKYIAILNHPASTEERKKVYARYRIPKTGGPDTKWLWPMLYGDSFGDAKDDAPNNDFIVHTMAARHLKNWLDGKYEADWKPSRRKVTKLSDLALRDQPEALNKAALHYCLADAFHPGCELTWPMRHATMYSGPFRIKRGPSVVAVPKDGDKLTLEIAKKSALQEQSPGDLTKWMAMPWHGDTAFCRSGYDPKFNPFLPSFWPARVPNQVLEESDYRVVLNSRDETERSERFSRRVHWLRALTGDPAAQMAQMVTDFPKIGVLEAMDGPDNHADFPSIMFVESLSEEAQVEFAAIPKVAAPRGASPEEIKILEAGWESKEQYEKFLETRRWRKKL